jgi:hypothetical protein
LRTIADNRNLYGLPVTNDPVVRDNYVLLITDGDPNCESGGSNCLSSCKNSNGKCGSNCIVNTALDQLLNLNPTIKTYTVGFAFTTIKSNLNCNAVYGGTSLCPPSVNRDNCDEYDDSACYYNANTPAALVTALSQISQQISGCTFDMDEAPPDIERLYVFTRDLEGGVPTGPYVPVSDDSSNLDGYYTLDGLRIQLFGPVCDRVRAGEEKPVVIYGCPQPGA